MWQTEWIAQFIGGLSFVTALFAYYQKDDTTLKALLCAVYIIHGVHFYLLEATTAALMCGLSLLRTLTTIYTSSLKVMFIFLLLTLVAGALSYSSVKDLLVVSAGIIGVYSLFRLSGIPMRVGIMMGASLWLLNNILVGSIGGVLLEVFVISVNLITIQRLKADDGRAQAI
ncbi:YgjV family protein [Alteromonas sp. KUL49]|uniref:YgjV family protein n=1 Tax=Alteromonas sp. KUL49 TaxID=2480798 RepID=UPI00102EE28D|nr:YgjV family protein [Alteromonas sp. KUL49]TAP37302.1 YgjV family protein [Alteromonas sp. KUL49]GEA12923.1 permease [Alteromonas sp. KUL49]